MVGNRNCFRLRPSLRRVDRALQHACVSRAYKIRCYGAWSLLLVTWFLHVSYRAAEAYLPVKITAVDVGNNRQKKCFGVASMSTSSSDHALPESSSPEEQQRLAPQKNENLTEIQNREHSGGDDAALEKESFAELYDNVLPLWLLERLFDCGWLYPTRIQRAALDAILIDKVDAVVQAQTGSGKTLSYLVPILANVDASRSAVQALIVVPTRELGLQVGRVAKRLAANSEAAKSNDATTESNYNDGDDDENDEGMSTTSIPTAASNKIMIMMVLQGSQNRRQRAWAWAEPPQVIIGTPEELCNMVRLGGIKRYNSVKYVVVDEVDACLLNNAGTMTSNLSSSTLHELLSKYLSPTYVDSSSRRYSSLNSEGAAMTGKGVSPTSRPLAQTRQTIFCSATIPQHRHFMKQCVQNQWVLSKDPRHICLQSGEQLVPSTLDHAYMVCASSEKKLAALRRILQKISQQAMKTSECSSSLKKVLIFAEPQRPLEEMAQILAKDLDGLLWKETYGPNEEANASVIIGVLRYEDSLSQRAAAIQSFMGETGAPISKHQWKKRSRLREAEVIPKKDNAKLRMLLSTDLAARGLDILDITHVIQLDLAPDADTYVHRSGRAGRFGALGQVISVISPEEEFVLKRLGNKLFIEMECIGRQKR